MAIRTVVDRIHKQLIRRQTGDFYGNIDLYDEEVLAGWVKRKENDLSQSIDVYLNGTLIAASVQAGLERPDVRDAGYGSGNYGFHVPLAQLVGPLRGTVEIAVHISGSETPLFSEVKTFASEPAPEQQDADTHEDAVPIPNEPAPEQQDADTHEDAVPIPNEPAPEQQDADTHEDAAPIANERPPKPAYKLSFEKLTHYSLEGWAVDKNNPSATFDVQILIDGIYYCGLRNDRTRPDLERAGVSDGTGGFLTYCALDKLEPGKYEITVRLPDGTSETKTIQCGHAHETSLITLSGRGTSRPTNPWLSSSPCPLAVVIPVYNAAEDLETCIARLAAHTPDWVDILFINDASPDPVIREILARTTAHANMRVLHNDENMGFTRTVNRGLSETGHADVIILNSDARVTPGWIAGMRAAVLSRPRVATVTAMSDRAGAFSAPKIGNENDLPDGVDEITYARSFRRRSLGLYPAVPTGNGFCMYITRACMEVIGLLDSDAFPRGYGEENDFCMRAGRAGWYNLIDDRTYVFHDRSKSFGETKTDLMRQGREVVDARDPEYKKAIAVYHEDPDILLVRYRAAQALRDCTESDMSRIRVLFVVSTKTGGTPQTNRDLMEALEDAVDGWLLRCDSRMLELSQLVNGEMVPVQQHRLSEPVDPVSHQSAEYDAAVTDFLIRLDPDIVHMRHLGWHGLSLPRIARELEIRTVFSFHDFYTLCPTVKLIDGDQRFCGGTCTVGEADCKAELWPENSLPRLRDHWVHTWRQRFSDALSGCDAFITTSDSARDRILKHLRGISAERFSVIPHGRDFHEFRIVRHTPDLDEKIRILVPGNINQGKGLKVIEDLIAHDNAGCLEFHILGNIHASDHEAHPRIVLHGPYARDDFATHAAKVRPHLGAIFSIWDETYCHTLTELWSAGLPALVFDYPTVAGRVRESGAGWVLDHDDIPALYERILELAFDPDEMQSRSAAVEAWQRGYGRSNTVRVMGANYLEIYRKTLMPDAPDMPKIGVVCPQHSKLRDAPASTQIRIWERTRNAASRDLCYIRLQPAALLDLVRRGAIDGAILQRNAIPRPMVAPLRAAFEESGIPFAIDLDDDLLDVPEDKDPQGTYADYAPFLLRLIEQASVVTVSTQPLQEKMRAINPEVVVLPNLLSDRLWRPPLPEHTVGNMVRALYMGTVTHADDLELLLPAIEEIQSHHPEFCLSLIGISKTFPAALPTCVETIGIPSDKKSYERFVPWLREESARFDFAVAPLQDTVFNSGKSALKVLDYAGLGLPVLASDTVVYRDLARRAPHVQPVANDTQSWVAALSQRITAGPANRADGAELRDWVLKHNTLAPSLDAYDAMMRKLVEPGA
jgi:GT2 family glycosyltransferase/glycosyltransferase involved in cell wall biosynthesis